jgi:hypothetical protein
MYAVATTKRRFIAGLIGLAYAAVTLVIGVEHHHEHVKAGSDDHCAACVWQISGATDAPVVITPIVVPHASVTVALPVVSSYFHDSYAFSDSRAPPAAA